MVEFVAYCTGKKAFCRKLVLFAVTVAVFRLDFIGAGNGALLALYGQAPFGSRLLTLERNYDGIYKLVKSLFDVYYHNAPVHPYLRCGKPGTVFRADGFLQIVQKRGKFAVKTFYLNAFFSQNGFTSLYHESS